MNRVKSLVKSFETEHNAWQRAFATSWLVCFATLTGCGGAASVEQQEAIAHIQEIGGRVNFKRGGYEVDLSKTAVDDRDLPHLKQISKLKNVDLQGTGVTDAGIENLRGIVSLEFVYLQHTACTREGVESLRKTLPKAQVLP